MLEISDELLVGRGRKRLVYVHPDDPSRCLKILNPQNTPTHIRGRKSWATRLKPLRCFDNNRVEFDEYRKLERRFSAIPDCFPAMYGVVATSRGPALMEDLIRNLDGTVSLNMRDFVNRSGRNDEVVSRLHPAMTHFASLLLSSQAMVHDLHPVNTVVQENGASLRLVVVDGLGTYSLVPCVYRLPGLAAWRMRKKLGGFSRVLSSWEAKARTTPTFRAACLFAMNPRLIDLIAQTADVAL
jgi:hypothetical protein